MEICVVFLFYTLEIVRGSVKTESLSDHLILQQTGLDSQK